MNFTEAVTEVVSITKRPDKQKDIEREVNKAINFYCIEANFARDRDEITLPLDANLFAQSVALSQFTRFRKVEALYLPYSKDPLTETDPAKIVSACGKDLLDVFYVGGDNLHIKQSQQAASVRVSYFKYSPVLTGTDTFWLLDVSPYMIIDKAASAIFFNIGDDTSGRFHKVAADEAYISAKRDYKYGVNH